MTQPSKSESTKVVPLTVLPHQADAPETGDESCGTEIRTSQDATRTDAKACLNDCDNCKKKRK